ncbi:DUF6159 family protein [Candidatus Poriferisodalis sp.]|uniref:DUF6159 family protein n=1 Tax=Candidatus Poriferisodalis sp. TaxID=3101277 RepID=UPI003B023EA9
MGRFANSWRLAKTSWSLLKQDRELLWLPVLSMGAMLVLAAAAIVVGFAVGDVEEGGITGSMAVIGIAFAVAMTAVAVFFEGALVAGAYDRMSGGDPTVRSAMSRAATHLPSLFGWALITVTVGIVIRFLRERLGWLGHLLSWVAEAAWAVATYLVVPAIVVDDERAVSGIKRSASLVKQTWGENLISQAGFGLLGFVLILPAVLAGALIAMIVPGTVGVVVGTAVGVAGVVTVIVVISALSVYFRTALYVYATQGEVLGGYDAGQMRNTFRAKQ